MSFSAAVSLDGNAANNQTVEWQVTGNTSANTTIDANGLLTVGTDEKALTLTVTAASAAFGVSATTEVTVPWNKLVEAITPGSADTVWIDDIEWYVLAKDNGKALIWSKDIICTHEFGSNTVWQDSTLRAYLNDEWLESTTVLKNKAVQTDITTRSQYNATTWLTTTDKVFLLSEADLFGTFNRKTTTDERDYTYRSEVIVPDVAMRKAVGFTYYWQRSPAYDATGVSNVISSSGIHNTNNSGTCKQLLGIRPALWVDLS